MPTAPCAKLNTPVVVYVSTSPLAATANTQPPVKPIRVTWRNDSNEPAPW